MSFTPSAVDELMRNELSLDLYPIVHAFASGPNCMPASATAPLPTCRVPSIVEVAVEAAVMVPAKYPLPFTSKAFEGELVPMPRNLLVLFQKRFELF